MSQPSLFTPVTWTITRLTQHIRGILESDLHLQDLWVQGEISNLSRPASGHLYFSLKDAGASLRTVMWRGEVARLRVPLQDGMQIEVHGRIGVYEPQGQYQFYADLIRPLGEGQLYQEFLRLKARFESEGLFAAERKRPIPELPARIGVVTSATGAALRDILDTLRRRLPLAAVTLAPSPVQGADAPPALAAALAAVDRSGVDVILLARGGGSMEDLWAFNDERVVRAVADARTPVITGVGHETDFTLCDFVADLRAPTPTAAAELATPVTILDLRTYLESGRARLARQAHALLAAKGHALELAASRFRSASPARRVQTGRQRLDDLARRRSPAYGRNLRLNRAHLTALARRLQALDPHAVLRRGYAIVTGARGRLVHRIAGVLPGEELNVQVSDGAFGARVTAIKES